MIHHSSMDVKHDRLFVEISHGFSLPIFFLSNPFHIYLDSTAFMCTGDTIQYIHSFPPSNLKVAVCHACS